MLQTPAGGAPRGSGGTVGLGRALLGGGLLGCRLLLVLGLSLACRLLVLLGLVLQTDQRASDKSFAKVIRSLTVGSGQKAI